MLLKRHFDKTPVKVKIRYGRESSQRRKSAYTMIFSNHATTEFGQACILGFKEIIKNAKMLEKQAFALAGAEEANKNSGKSVKS